MRIERSTTRDDSMSLRVVCKSVGCSRTILAATAARTGGYCMPCVQTKERKQREAHIRANRRDVDPYAGIDDPLELLKIVHQPPKPDPLIRYAAASEANRCAVCRARFGPDRCTGAPRARAPQEGRYARGARHSHLPGRVRVRRHQLVAAGVHPLRGTATGVRVSSRRAEDSRFADSASRSRRGTRSSAHRQASLCARVGRGRAGCRSVRGMACPTAAVGQRICTFLHISIRSKQVGSCRPIRSGAICITRSATRSLAPAPR